MAREVQCILVIGGTDVQHLIDLVIGDPEPLAWIPGIQGVDIRVERYRSLPAVDLLHHTAHVLVGDTLGDLDAGAASHQQQA